MGLFPEINFFGNPSKVQCLCGFTGFGADVTSQYVDTAGKNAKKIQEYIQKQLEEDKAGEQLTMGNF